MTRQKVGGLYKRCDCARRKWLKCGHPWHFDFYKSKKYRFSLDVIATARGEKPPRSKGDAEALADRIRSEIRSGIFRDPNHPEQTPSPDPTALLTVADVIDSYIKRHVENPTRRESARRTMKWHLGVLRRTEIPAAHGQTIRFELKPIKEITKADIEAIRDARRRAQIDAIAAREQWEREAAALKKGETMNRPKPRLLPGAKGGEVGINRLFERLRHLFSWAIAEGYIESTPFKRQGVVVVKLEKRIESARHRRLAAGEEDRLLKHASPHLHALIIAALETGCRLGELLNLQWRDVEHVTGSKGERLARFLVLTADKTKTSETRRVPVSSRLRAVLGMRSTDPKGKEFGPDRYVFGNEVGERIGSIRTTWRATCRRAKINDLHFHDLRREFGSRLLESGASQHIVRDFLGHASISTTSRYLATTAVALERAMAQFEAHNKLNNVTGAESEGLQGHSKESHGAAAEH